MEWFKEVKCKIRPKKLDEDKHEQSSEEEDKKPEHNCENEDHDHHDDEEIHLSPEVLKNRERLGDINEAISQALMMKDMLIEFVMNNKIGSNKNLQELEKKARQN